MTECTDAELVEAARNGDVSSFGELYRRHYATAVAIAYCAVSDHHLAEDAAQESFAVACRDLVRLRRADKFAPWLGGICRKLACRLAKTKPPGRLPDDAVLPAEDCPDDDQKILVRQAVQCLPASAREVIVLHYFSNLTHEQIAATLDISPQAVHGRLIRARKKLTDYLRRNGLGGR